MTAKRVAIYARVATDKQTTAQQLNELRSAADRHGWEVVGEYIDNGVSGRIQSQNFAHGRAWCEVIGKSGTRADEAEAKATCG